MAIFHQLFRQYICRRLVDGRRVYGTYTKANGEVYVGEWKADPVRDKWHGKGKMMTYSSGNVFDGDWVDGQRVYGSCTYADSGNIYTGEWKDDKKHGKGKLVSASGKVLKEGTWVDGMFTRS